MKEMGLQVLFYLFVLMNIADPVPGMTFFPQLCFRFWIEIFSYCTFMERFAIGFQKQSDHERIEFWVLNKGNCLQLLFYFIVLMGIVASVKGMRFSAVFQDFG